MFCFFFVKRTYIYILSVIFIISLSVYAQSPVEKGPEFKINTSTYENYYHATISVDSAGNFVAAWGSYNDNYDAIHGQKFDNQGNKTGVEFAIDTLSDKSKSAPYVIMDNEGGFIVFWSSSNNIYGQRFNSSSKEIGNKFKVNTNSSSSPRYPSAAIDSNGNFVVVWETIWFGGGNCNVFGQRFNKNADKIGSEFRINTYSAEWECNPSVGMDSGGNFVVVWQAYLGDTSGFGILGQKFDNSGSKIGEEFIVNTTTYSTQESPSISFGDNGGFFVTWESFLQDGSSYGIIGQRFDTQWNKSGGEFLINTYTDGSQTSPSAAIDGEGNIVFVWLSFGQIGNNYELFGQIFNQNGNKLGGEFFIADTSNSAQHSKSVAFISDTTFVVVWSSQRQDGSAFGIFGRMFSFSDNNIPTFINENNSNLPATFNLSQNYPNPFNPITTIRYQIPQQSFVSLEIYNILGQEITTLVSRNQAPGSYKILWNGKNNKGIIVPSSIYMCRLCAGGYTKSIKMLFLK